MRETNDRIIKLTFIKNINTTSSRHSIAINEDSNIEVRKMLKDS